MVRSYRIQTGRCPGPRDNGSKVSILIWDFNHQNKLFQDTFKTDLFFEDIEADFTKDGSVIVIDGKSKHTIRRYSRIADRQWQFQP